MKDEGKLNNKYEGVNTFVICLEVKTSTEVSLEERL
jgi:hypothetical protein